MSILSYYIGPLLTLCTLIDFCLLLGTYINESFSHLSYRLRLLSSIRVGFRFDVGGVGWVVGHMFFTTEGSGADVWGIK